MPFTAFISDLHLTHSRPHINRLFFSFIEDTARAADALYILGDLFEYWAGDDDVDDPLNTAVAAALKGLRDAGVQVFMMRGNRDFLLHEGFAERAALELIEDPTVVDLYSVRTLLMHGDTLCTDDVRYQTFRRRTRSGFWRRLFLAQPLWLRHAEIRRARRLSEAQKQVKPREIMDVTPSAVEAALRASGAARLIHGHTHRPAHHSHVVDDVPRERWVLADWYERGEYLRVSPEGCEPVQLDSSADA